MEFNESGMAIHFTGVHQPELCEGRLCDFHGKPGVEPWASWPRNWRDDRGMVEMIDPKTGIGHPSPAQVQYFQQVSGKFAWAYISHGCDGGCAGAYDQLD